MTSPRVCDASALIALLIDGTSIGAWCHGALRGFLLSAPSVAAFETANVIRRRESAGLLDHEVADRAHQNLGSLRIDWWDYRPLSGRIWQLRRNVTVYDASYVALAELLDAPLVTLDQRLTRAPGIRCETLTPPS